jgi:plastocyanin
MKKRWLAAALPLLFAVGACGGDDDGGGAAAEPGVVIVEDNVFKPKTIKVGVGDTVTWRFEGNSAHNVVFDEGEGSDLMKDGTFERTFDEAGTFDYTCTVHPGMSGKVDVSNSAAP